MVNDFTNTSLFEILSNFVYYDIENMIFTDLMKTDKRSNGTNLYIWIGYTLLNVLFVCKLFRFGAWNSQIYIITNIVCFTPVQTTFNEDYIVPVIFDNFADT